ncbi:MAG: DMT family transporter [Pseudomonadota bacterium]
MFDGITKPKHNTIFLIIGVCALSLAGVLIKLTHANIFSIAFYRLFIAAVILFLYSPIKILNAVKNINSKELFWMSIGGAVFSLHLILWIYSLTIISVFEAMVIMASNPIYATIGAYLIFKERPRDNFIPSFVLAFAGTVLTFIDGFSSTGKIGGMIAVFVSTLLFAAYVLTSKKARMKTNTQFYIFMLYGAAALVCFIFMLVTGSPIVDYTARNYLFFVLLALIPTVIGHGSLNHCVGYFRASTISMLTLLEPVIGSVVAYFVLSEPVGRYATTGFVLIVFGIMLLFKTEIFNGVKYVKGKVM